MVSPSHVSQSTEFPVRKSPLVSLVGVLQGPPCNRFTWRLQVGWTARRPRLTSSSRCGGRGQVVEETQLNWCFALALLRPFRSFHPLTLGSFITHGSYCNLPLPVMEAPPRNSTLRTRTSGYPNRVRGEAARGLRPEARGSARHEISCRRRAKRVFFRARCRFYVTLTQVRNSCSHALFFFNWPVRMNDSIQMLSILRKNDNRGAATRAETIERCVSFCRCKRNKPPGTV